LEHPAPSLISGRAARLAAPNLEERFTAKAAFLRKETKDFKTEEAREEEEVVEHRTLNIQH
jgi:hypothetical protein